MSNGGHQGPQRPRPQQPARPSAQERAQLRPEVLEAYRERQGGDPFAAYEDDPFLTEARGQAGTLSPADEARLQAFRALSELDARQTQLHAVPPDAARWLGRNAPELLEERGLNSAYASRTGRLFKRTGSPGLGRDLGDVVGGGMEAVAALPRALLELPRAALNSLRDLGLSLGVTYGPSKTPDEEQAARRRVVEPVVSAARSVARAASFPFEADELTPGERATRARELGGTVVNVALLGRAGQRVFKRPQSALLSERAPVATPRPSGVAPSNAAALETHAVRLAPEPRATPPREAPLLEPNAVSLPEGRLRSVAPAHEYRPLRTAPTPAARALARRLLKEKYVAQPGDSPALRLRKALNRSLNSAEYERALRIVREP